MDHAARGEGKSATTETETKTKTRQDDDDGERLAAEFHEETLISYEFCESLSSRGANPHHLPGENSDETEKFHRARAYI